MKQILFIVNGLGLGNSTRSDSIIQALISRGYRIDVLTSGNGIDYFNHIDQISNLYQFRSFYYGSSDGKLSIWRTILAIPNFILIFISNILYLKNLVQKKNYKAIVIDSDYTLLWLKRGIKIPIIALNNADIVVEECNKLSTLPKEIKMQYWLERCDNWFHQKVPDLVISPAILNKKMKGKLKHFAPFVRSGLDVRPPNSELKNILVMLSGSMFGSPTEFLNRLTLPEEIKVDVVGRDGESSDQIVFHGKDFSNKPLVNKADMMVVNGGFSAVSEAVVLRKPVVVIPVENHAEQFINGLVVEKAGLGFVATMENAETKILQLIEKFPEIVENHKQFDCESNGSDAAAQIIDTLVLERNSQTQIMQDQVGS